MGKKNKNKPHSINYAKKSFNEDLGWTKVQNKNKMKCSICQSKSNTEKECKFIDTGVFCYRCKQKEHHYYAWKMSTRNQTEWSSIRLNQRQGPIIELIFICTHVDDLPVVGPSTTGQNLVYHLQQVQPRLVEKMGPLSRFLGRTYRYSSDINGYLVSLYDYILEKNPSFNPETKIAKTPVVANIQLKPVLKNPSSLFPYCELTVSLIYLSLLRPVKWQLDKNWEMQKR